MYPISSAVLEALKSPSRQVSGGVWVYIGSDPVPDFFSATGNLIEYKIDRAAPAGKFFGFMVVQKLTVKVMGSYPVPKGSRLQPTFTVFVDGTENTTTGINFYVEDSVVDEVANTTTITAYDILQQAENTTIDEVEIIYPLTLDEYADAVLTALGTEKDGSIGSVNPLITVANINGTETLREILTAITEASGTVCYVHSGNKIKFRSLPQSAAEDIIDGANYFNFTTKDAVTLTQVASTTQLGENISYGNEGFMQAIWDNPFLDLREDIETVLEALGDKVIGTTMIPCELTWRGNPYYEIGDRIEVKTVKSVESKYIYVLNESFTFNGGFKSVINWDSEEQDDINSTPTNLSAVLKQTSAKVDKVNNEINLVAANTERNEESISALQINTQNINASVQQMRQTTNSAIEGINSDIELLIQRVDTTLTPEAVEIQIQNAMKQGTTAVTTTTGFTFNEEGLTVAKSGSEMTTQITEDGMTVYKDSSPMLVANNEGVEAINLNASTYLIVGLNSRFEDYDGGTRTGCFWIGG